MYFAVKSDLKDVSNKFIKMLKYNQANHTPL